MKTTGYGLLIILNAFFVMQANSDQVYLVVKKISRKGDVSSAQEAQNLFTEKEIKQAKKLAQSKDLKRYFILHKQYTGMMMGLPDVMWSEYCLAVLLNRSQVNCWDKIKYEKISKNIGQMYDYTVQKKDQDKRPSKKDGYYELC